MAKSVCHNLPKLLLQHNRVLANNLQNGKTLPESFCKTFHSSQSRLAGIKSKLILILKVNLASINKKNLIVFFVIVSCIKIF